MGDRVHCCVPFCNRTFKAEGASEMMCGKHVRMTSKRLRNLHTAARRKCETLMDKYPHIRDAPDDIHAHILRFAKIEQWLWNKMKREAIEAAGGIG